MGTIGNTGRLAAFQSDVFASGLDLGRCVINHDLGVYRAAEGATILQGQMVSLNADGELALADAGDVFGVAKWNKAAETDANSLAVDEPVVVTDGGVSSLKRGNVSNLVVRDAAGTAIPAASNYTLSAANGTLTWANPPAGTNAPADGDTVFVTYTFDLTATDFRFQGRNFFNQLDDVSIAENRLTIIQGPATLFTTQYDTSQAYAVNDELYVGSSGSSIAGLFTTDDSEGTYVGKVIQPPTATDPYLGVYFTGHPEEE